MTASSKVRLVLVGFGALALACMAVLLTSRADAAGPVAEGPPIFEEENDAPAPAPPPATGTRKPKSVLIVQVGWAGQQGGTNPSGPFSAPSRLLEPANLADAWFREASYGRVDWNTTYAGAFTIPTPRSGFVRAGQPNSCGTAFFLDIRADGAAAARAQGIDPDAYDLTFYVYNGSVCIALPDPHGYQLSPASPITGPAAAILETTSVNFAEPLGASQTLISAVGSSSGLGHATAFECKGPNGERIPIGNEGNQCELRSDPYSVIGAGGGSFGAADMSVLGWLDDAQGSEVTVRQHDGVLREETIAPLTAGPGRTGALHQRAIRLPDAAGSGSTWIEYRPGTGVDAPERTGSNAVPGLLIHRAFAAGANTSTLIDATPQTPASDAGLPVGKSLFTPRAEWRITLKSVDGEKAKVEITNFATEGADGAPIGGYPHREPPANPDQHSLLVLNVGWDRPDPTEAAMLRPAQIDRVAYLINHATNEWFERSAPAGMFEPWDAYSGPAIKIPLLRRVHQGGTLPDSTVPFDIGDCDTADDSWEFANILTNEADALARARGVDPDEFGHVVYVSDRSFCGFNGLSVGLFSNRQTLVGARVPKVATLTHELGHHFNIGHAESLTCRNQVGAYVTFGGACTADEYGDPVDAMGGFGSGAFSPALANSLGWLDFQFVGLEAGDYSKTFHLEPYVGGESPRPGVLRAIRLQDGGETFWMEYRVPTGPDADRHEGDAPIAPGLYVRRQLIHRDVPIVGVRMDGTPRPQLLDMTPDGNFANAALRAGQTWINPLGTMKVTVVGADSFGAFVRVERATLPVPNLRGRATSEARIQLEAVGLHYGGSTGSVDDCTGALFGKVVDQFPSAGTRVLPGRTVTVTLGQKPKFPGNCQ